MPVIAYKTMTLNGVWVQVRLIRCGHCSNSFRYLATGTGSASSTGLPLLSSDEGMRKSVAQSLQKSFNKIAQSTRQGVARCPSCRRFQAWMVSRSKRRLYAIGIVLGVVLGALALFVTSLIVSALEPYAGIATLAGAVAGGAVGTLLAKRKVLPEGAAAPDTNDARAMTESGFRDHQQKCAEKDWHPTLAWYAMLGGKFPEKVAVLPLPDFDDQAASRPFP